MWSSKVANKSNDDILEKKENQNTNTTKNDKLYNHLSLLKKQQKNNKFQNWLNMRTEYDLKHKTLISEFCQDILKTVSSSNFTIGNEKQFKNEIATFIYQLSNAQKRNF